MSRTKKGTGRPIESYQHTDHERLNNPPVGLVTPDTDPDGQAQTYAYDPHLDPQLTWAGKADSRVSCKTESKNMDNLTFRKPSLKELIQSK